jgi:hypothetical protein
MWNGAANVITFPEAGIWKKSIAPNSPLKKASFL